MLYYFELYTTWHRKSGVSFALTLGGGSHPHSDMEIGEVAQAPDKRHMRHFTAD